MGHPDDDSASSRGCFFYGCVITALVIAVVAAAVGGLVYYGYSGQSGVRAVADEYLAAVEDGDFLHAHDLLSAEWRARMNADDFAGFEQQTRAALGDCSDRTLRGINLSSGSESSVANLSFVTTCPSGPIVIELRLIREEGEWAVAAEEYVTPQPERSDRCPSCGAINPPGANFCSNCGTGLG